jgi:hypothetical protein
MLQCFTALAPAVRSYIKPSLNVRRHLLGSPFRPVAAAVHSSNVGRALIIATLVRVDESSPSRFGLKGNVNLDAVPIGPISAVVVAVIVMMVPITMMPMAVVPVMFVCLSALRGGKNRT